MRIRCDCWTISAFDFVVLLHSFFIYFICLLLGGDCNRHTHAPISVLPWTAGKLLGFCGFDKTIGTSGVDFLVVVPLTLPL